MFVESKSLSLVHRYQPAQNSDASTRSPLLVLLHGLGSNEDDLFGLAPYFDPRYAIVSARAPKLYGNGGYAWFDLTATPQGIGLNLEDALHSRAIASTFVREAQQAYNSKPAQTILCGFSQGAIMSASVLLTEPALVAGAVLMSGLVLPDLPLASRDVLANKPVLITHGKYDEVISVSFAQSAHTLLVELGLTVEYHEYPMGHTLSEECIETIDEWLQKRL